MHEILTASIRTHIVSIYSGYYQGIRGFLRGKTESIEIKHGMYELIGPYGKIRVNDYRDLSWERVE